MNRRAQMEKIINNAHLVSGEELELVIRHRNPAGVQITRTYVWNEDRGEFDVSMTYGPAENYGINGKEGV